MQLNYEFNCPERKIDVTDANAPGVDAQKPLVLLLHGLGGDKDNMSSKVATKGGQQGNLDHRGPLPADQDLGWWVFPPPAPPVIHHFSLDNAIPAAVPGQVITPSLTGWKDFLEGNGFRTAVYSQIDSWDLLARPVEELAVVFRTLDANLPTQTKIVILAHSRGGLLARKFIKDAVLKKKFGTALSTAVTARLTKVITLHSPHLGTSLANLALALNSTITTLEAAFGSVARAALGWLADLTASKAYQELAVGSPFLTDLATGEVALPGVAYHTFGGTSVTLTRLLAWTYTLGSYVPQWHWPPYNHVITCGVVPLISPVMDGVPGVSGLTVELTPGKGDILTADAGDHLGFSVRHTNALNHAEAQWDSNLEKQVLGIL